MKKLLLQNIKIFISFALCMTTCLCARAQAQTQGNANAPQQKQEVDFNDLLPSRHTMHMMQEAIEYADKLSKSGDVKKFVDSTSCAVRIGGFYNHVVKQNEKPNGIAAAIVEYIKKMWQGKGTNQPHIDIDMLWTGLEFGFREGEPAVSTTMEVTPTVGSLFLKEKIAAFVSNVESYTDTSLYIASSRADQCIIKELAVLQTDTQNKKETSLPYLPWMNYAILEAKTMDGVTECEEPLFSKGNEYHSQGGYASFCICGNKQHSSYCDPSAWCASFVNWCLRQSNTSHTKSAGSQTFLKHSEFVKISEPVFGAIAVFTNLDGNGDFKTTGHVAFVVGTIGNDQILCLGGNQSQTIKVSLYSLSQDKKRRLDKSLFRGYYIPKAYTNKLKDYKTSITDYTNAKIANQQIINLNINSTENESTR